VPSSTDFRFYINADEWRRKLKALYERVIPYVRRTFAILAEEAKTRLQVYTPQTSPGRTNIAALWEVDRTTTEAQDLFVLRNTYRKPEVILFFEEGTRPHIIRPRRAKALRFFIDGDEIHARNVWHPGTREHRMIWRTRGEITELLDRYIIETGKMIDSMVGGG
jgi:hypothetical protein